MKKKLQNILHIPADKIKNEYDLGILLAKGSNYNIFRGTKRGTEEAFIVIKAKAESDKETFQLESILETVDKLGHHHALFIEAYSYEMLIEKNNRKHWDFYLIYEPFECNLEVGIETKRSKDSRFLDMDLSQNMQDLVSFFALLEHKKYDHKAIHPQNFYVQSRNDVKFDAYRMGHMNVLGTGDKPTSSEFLAPEQLTKQKVPVNQFRSEVFSLGVIFLYMASLQKPHGWNKDPKKVVEIIEEHVINKYSKYTVELLRMMLTHDHTKRPDFATLYVWNKSNQRLKSLKAEHAEGYNSPKGSPKGAHLDKIQFINSEQKSPTHGRRGSFKDVVIDSPDLAPSKFKSNKMADRTDYQNEHSIQLTYVDYEKKGRFLYEFLVGKQEIAFYPCLNIKASYQEIEELDIDFTIPNHHVSVINEYGQIFMIGGQKTKGMNSNCYSFQVGSENKELREHSPMNEPLRLKPGVIAVQDKIFVIGGGKISPDIADLQSTEVYSIKTDTWKKLVDLQYPAAGALYMNYQNKIIYKYGGKDPKGGMVNMVERYFIDYNQWEILQGLSNNDDIFYLKDAAGTQINNNELFVFGGENLNGQSANQTFGISCNDAVNGNENLQMISKYNPKDFGFNKMIPNKVKVLDNAIWFLTKRGNETQLNLFKDGVWKELKSHLN